MASLQLRVCDPHFHVWDTTMSPNANLGEVGETLLPQYIMESYETDCQAEPGGVEVVGLVHVEATVGQEEGGAVLDPVAETRFAVGQLEKSKSRSNAHVVAFVHLGRPNAEEVIKDHQEAAGGRLVGIRMILNYSSNPPEYCWPQVGSGDYLRSDAAFKQGFSLLDKHGLSFDLQVNWFQLSEAAAFLSGFPDTKVVVDHMGCLKLGAGKDEDEERMEVWRTGMKALAALPNVYVKASYFEYMLKGWQVKGSDAYALVKRLLHEVIGLFGVDRVMFASNFPVDKLEGSTTLPALFHDLHSLVDHLTGAEQAALLRHTAARFYRLSEQPR